MRWTWCFWIGCLAALGTGMAMGGGGRVGVGKDFKGPVGLQLYSLRDSFKADVPGSLEKVQALGFRHVELAGTYGMAPDVFRKMLARHRLKPIAAHFPYEQFRDDAERVAREAKALGIKYAGVAWIPHEGDFDEAECRQAIGVFNRAGAVLARHGVKFFYHVHGYEFQPYREGTLFDLMMRETDPKRVCYEMDVFWVVFPAQDPVRLLEQYGRRWELMHLKDMRRGLPLGSLSGGTDVRNDVALGAGQIDLPPLLRAARKAGTRWYFIEDESPSVEIQLPQSLRFLESVRF
ncbi:MAG TPA: sugar phosphate isomerase/epimerase [Verrucomicrobiota bacterium]|nr:sugar phosphate isomerase/epimerase [Verrucomicrobiota bacterium]HNU52535.1 sugar phosphate isomerase/epimerase [Verrucomicrobiota bacterium]